MSLLQQIPKVHDNFTEIIDGIYVDYHQYLNDLEQRNDSNKELINCLQTLEADYYFSECHRNFLLALIENSSKLKEKNVEMNL
jgi:hypothetical protein